MNSDARRNAGGRSFPAADSSPGGSITAAARERGCAMDEIRKKHVPGILVDTTDLSREEWLDYRRRGIGGSDAAAVLGISPFLTGRDIYYEKTGTERLAALPDNWVALEVGHLLEDLTAKIFSEQTGLPVYQKKKMFYHPSCTFMLADLDYLATMPDGRTATSFPDFPRLIRKTGT